jgi:hypothetical protein
MRNRDYWVLLHSEQIGSTGGGMETRVTLRPGEKGTKALVAEYGDRLICVRYRYDAAARLRYKTVELVVEQVAWEPGGRDADSERRPGRHRAWWACALRTRIARCSSAFVRWADGGYASWASGCCR